MQRGAAHSPRALEPLLGTHRLQLSGVPLQVLSHVHHLVYDTIQLLHTRKRPRSVPVPRIPNCPLFLLPRLTELSRMPFPSVSYRRNITEGRRKATAGWTRCPQKPPCFPAPSPPHSHHTLPLCRGRACIFNMRERHIDPRPHAHPWGCYRPCVVLTFPFGLLVGGDVASRCSASCSGPTWDKLRAQLNSHFPKQPLPGTRAT